MEITLDKNSKLKIERMSNINGLLNLCSEMKQYGPLRLYWEGSFKGEGLFTYVKPMIKQGTHKSTFAKNALIAYYKDRFFQTVLKVDLTNEEDGEQNNIRYNKFYTYRSDKQIEENLNSGVAVSIIILKSGVICTCYKHKTK